MAREAVGLAILFVPLEVEPRQSVENGLEGCLGITFQIGIVDAEDHVGAVAPRVEPVEDESARAADVQIARRRGREPNSEHEIRV